MVPSCSVSSQRYRSNFAPCTPLTDRSRVRERVARVAAVEALQREHAHAVRGHRRRAGASASASASERQSRTATTTPGAQPVPPRPHRVAPGASRREDGPHEVRRSLPRARVSGSGAPRGARGGTCGRRRRSSPATPAARPRGRARIASRRISALQRRPFTATIVISGDDARAIGGRAGHDVNDGAGLRGHRQADRAGLVRGPRPRTPSPARRRWRCRATRASSRRA